MPQERSGKIKVVKLSKEERIKKETEEKQEALKQLVIEYHKIKPMNLKIINDYLEDEIDNMILAVGSDEQKKQIEIKEYQELQKQVNEMKAEVLQMPDGELKELIEEEILQTEAQLKEMKNIQA